MASEFISWLWCGCKMQKFLSSISTLSCMAHFSSLLINRLAGGCALLLLFILLESELVPEISTAARDSRLPQGCGRQVRYRKACQIPLHRQFGPLGRVLAHVVGNRHGFEGIQDVRSPVQNSRFRRRHPLHAEWV